MSKVDIDGAYLRTEQVVMLGEGVPVWAAATDNALREGALALLPFLMKRLTDDEWAEAMLEARLVQRRLGGRG